MRPTVTFGRGLAGSLVLSAMAAVAQSAPDPAPMAAAVRPAAAIDSMLSLSGTAGERGYRSSFSRGSLDLGLRFEPRPAASHPADARFDSAAPPGATWPALSIDLRSVSTGPAPASSLVERAFGTSAAVSRVSKVGIQWKPVRSQVFLRRGIGFRLSGDDRVTMRLRKGSFKIYMKRTF